MRLVGYGVDLWQGQPCFPSFIELRRDLRRAETDQMLLPSFPDRAMQARRGRVEPLPRCVDLVGGKLA